jgi:transcriptional regulator with XRE-family HTH domain
MSDPKFTLRAAREHAGLTRLEVAAALGISAKTLERWEKANRARRPVVERIAKLYGLELELVAYEPAPARAAA